MFQTQALPLIDEDRFAHLYCEDNGRPNRKTLRLALESGLTAYDAAYLYVARTLRIPLVTFDARLGRAARTV